MLTCVPAVVLAVVMKAEPTMVDVTTESFRVWNSLMSIQTSVGSTSEMSELNSS